jgi:ubiquinone/menaquinone biosynthesis C-methylase UbiE
MAYPERIVPDETEHGIVALHLKRYVFAEPWCQDRDVLDIACGVGYGTAHLAPAASTIVGADLSEKAIDYARSRYPAPNATYVVADAAALPFERASFDTVCSFETLEHLPDRDAYLAEVVRVLRRGGTYLVSTPHAVRTTEHPDNPFHTIELDRGDFEALLRRYFANVDLWGQHRRQTRRHRAMQRLDLLGLRRRLSFLRGASAIVGTAPTAEVTLDGIVVDRDLKRAKALIAVCS